jgi:hypothetical protein
VEELVAELGEPQPRVRGPLVVDVILERVDLSVRRVEQVEVGVRDVVDQALDEDPDPQPSSEAGRSTDASKAGPSWGVFRTVTSSSGVATMPTS